MIAAEMPHFLLFSEVHTRLIRDIEAGYWRFQLQSLEGDDHFSAAGSERQICRDRLEVLAVLRGLEALDQPSRVTLLCGSRYVQRGLRHGLENWEQNNWQWERFGRRVQVKNYDLWQRVSQALQFHRLDCRLWRVDPGSQAHKQAGQDSAPVRRPHFLNRRQQKSNTVVEELPLADAS